MRAKSGGSVLCGFGAFAGVGIIERYMKIKNQREQRNGEREDEDGSPGQAGG